MTTHHLIRHCVQHIVSCLSTIDLNICKQLQIQKASVWGIYATISPLVTFGHLIGAVRLKPVKTQIKSPSSLFLLHHLCLVSAAVLRQQP